VLSIVSRPLLQKLIRAIVDRGGSDSSSAEAKLLHSALNRLD
jgi:hypothetical protein